MLSAISLAVSDRSCCQIYSTQATFHPVKTCTSRILHLEAPPQKLPQGPLAAGGMSTLLYSLASARLTPPAKNLSFLLVSELEGKQKCKSQKGRLSATMLPPHSRRVPRRVEPRECTARQPVASSQVPETCGESLHAGKALAAVFEGFGPQAMDPLSAGQVVWRYQCFLWAFEVSNTFVGETGAKPGSGGHGIPKPAPGNKCPVTLVKEDTLGVHHLLWGRKPRGATKLPRCRRKKKETP